MSDQLNNDLQHAIDDIVNKHLPASLGHQLTKRLQAINDLESHLKAIQTELAAKKEIIIRLNKKLDDSNKLIASTQELEEKEKAFDEKVKKFEKEQVEFKSSKLQYQLQESEKRADVVTDLVKLIFRSPIVEKTTNVSGNTQHTDSSGMTTGNSYENKTINESTNKH